MSIRVAQGRSPAGPVIGVGVVGIAALLVLIIAIFGSFTVQVSSLRQTGAGVIIFAEVKDTVHTPVVSEAA